MSDSVIYKTQGQIAYLLLNSAPVNGLGQAVRQGLSDGFAQASQDNTIKAIVVGSNIGPFCGGADIAEFSAGTFADKPLLPQVFNQIDASSKPVIAAIDGLALGGGLELALACDYRVATNKAKLGLPEVHLGILPGAGGTQRLPRLAGIANALQMIVSGTPVSAQQAQQLGFVDLVVKEGEDVITAATNYAEQLLAQQAPALNCADMPVDRESLPSDYFAEFRKSIERKTRGFYAPERCIQAVEAACVLPLVDGLKKEGELFLECINTPQARAQQHLFFAERAAGKVPGVAKDTQARPVKKVAVIGSGTMGGGIVMNFLNAGFATTMLDLNAQALERGVGVIRKNYEITAKKGKLTGQQVEQRMGLLTTSTQYSDIQDADLVIEAVFEKMDVKKAVFKTLDECCKPGAILATNTSTLDVNEIAEATSRPQDVIGLHFFSPANVMRLLEVVRAEKTSPDVIKTVLGCAAKIKKLPVVVGVCFGFVGNRMLEPYGREALRLLLEGATPEQIDRVLTEFGFPMGFCSMIDLAGNDISYLTRQAHPEVTQGDPSYGALVDSLYELGHYGQKTGCGFYQYNGRDKSANPDVITLAEQAAFKHGITRREISDQEVLERCLYPLINEGALILEEGIAARASDCDLIYVNGYGFPAWRGGPMQYANEIGLTNVLNALNKYKEQLGEYGERWFKPAPLLQKLATDGKSFNAV
ncbi:3-hydroxyacyl-CoA dehydrogenase NAD-binding domain-containing protein [Halioxenophilus aromaticivorans]|uniref:3-hydroxyacyl-CoA dehydrogenase NAD-binding domain-containing protein n=1 Tax=Halioxenophilus aromaticivorans TaxID=1306992 RepID=A0AAV3U2Q8_9ALTE